MDKPINLEGMKEAAASTKVREEFRLLSERSRRRAAQVDLKIYLQFLTFMSRLCPTPPPPRLPMEFSRALL